MAIYLGIALGITGLEASSNMSNKADDIDDDDSVYVWSEDEIKIGGEVDDRDDVIFRGEVGRKVRGKVDDGINVVVGAEVDDGNDETVGVEVDDGNDGDEADDIDDDDSVYVWSEDEIKIGGEVDDHDDVIFQGEADDGNDGNNVIVGAEVDDDHVEVGGKVDVNEEINSLCELVGVPLKFASREDAEYQIRLSQCKMRRSFKVQKSDKRAFYICCAHGPCAFSLRVLSSKNGVYVTGGDGNHTCSVNDHVIAKYKSPASNSKFLALYLRDYICSNTTKNGELCRYVLLELGCEVTPSTMNRALEIATTEYLHDHMDGFKLLVPYMYLVNERGGYSQIDSIT